MRFSGSRHVYNFVSSKSGITLLLLNWKSSFNYFGITKSLVCLELAYDESERNKIMKLIEYFLFV